MDSKSLASSLTSMAGITPTSALCYSNPATDALKTFSDSCKTAVGGISSLISPTPKKLKASEARKQKKERYKALGFAPSHTHEILGKNYDNELSREIVQAMPTKLQKRFHKAQHVFIHTTTHEEKLRALETLSELTRNFI